MLMSDLLPGGVMEVDATYGSTVYYDPNGGVGGPGLVTYQVDDWTDEFVEGSLIPDEVPTRAGYRFIGCGHSPDYCNGFQPGRDLYKSLADYTKTLYAGWEKIPYTDLKFTSDPITDGKMEFTGAI